MERCFIAIPLKGIGRLATLNGIQLSKLKSAEEAKEYLDELVANSADEKLLEEAADTIVTMLQVLMHKSLLDNLPKTILEKVQKGLDNYGEINQENIPVFKTE